MVWKQQAERHCSPSSRKLSSPFLSQELRFIVFIHYQDPLTKFCIFPHPPYHHIHLVYVQDGEGVCDLKALSPDPQQLNPCLLIQRFPLSSVAGLGHSDILWTSIGGWLVSCSLSWNELLSKVSICFVHSIVHLSIPLLRGNTTKLKNSHLRKLTPGIARFVLFR